MAKNKTRKIIITTAVVIVTIMMVVIAFISPISKYLVEKYSVKYLGRQVRMSWIYLNPFTGYVHIGHLKVYEYQNDTIFFKADGVSAKLAMLKLLCKTYEISYLTVNRPWGRIVQNRRLLNFTDMIQRFSPDTTAPRPQHTEKVHFNLLNITITDGEFHYIEETIGVNYFIKDFNLKSPGLRWDVDSIGGNFALRSGPSKGDIKADFSINIRNLDYRVAALINNFELDIIEQYLHDLANYGSFSANLDANLKATGNFKDQLDIIASGKVGVNDFHFGKVQGQDFASFDTLLLVTTEVNPKHYKYLIDSVALRHPFFKYERYDHLDNLQTMFGENGSNYTAAKADSSKFNLIVRIVDFITALSKNFMQSYYKIDRIAIYRGNVKYSDYAIREEFSISADPLNIVANAVDRNNKRVSISLLSGIVPFGNLGINLSIDPRDYNQFDLAYNVQKLSVPSFNPYVITYTSFPLDRGTLELNGKWHVSDSHIQSDNHLLVIDPRIGKRLRHKDTKWVPVPLIMSIVRTPGNVIDFDIPIEGNLKDPKFKLRDVIAVVLKNIFVKPPSVPYLMHVKEEDTEVEKMLTIKWPMRSAVLKPLQNKFLSKMADFLKKKTDAAIVIVPLEYTTKEKEYALFFEAKKKYYSLTHAQSNHGVISEKDSIEIDKMSVKDSAFVRFLDAHVHARDSLLFTIQEKCMAFVGDAVVNTGYARLQNERKQVVLNYFKDKGVQGRVKANQSIALIPHDGFSYFKIDYKGELPDDLIRAYNEMNELDNKTPRGKYENERLKDGGVLPEAQEARQVRKTIQNR